MTQYLLVITTVPDADVGQIIAEKVIEERLASCVHIQTAGQSIYWWGGKVMQDQEHTLLIKTKNTAYLKLEKKIKEIHPYDVPEIIALPIQTGSDEYLSWIDTEVQA
jgi:periplasmic divalent cation tolerance protein